MMVDSLPGFDRAGAGIHRRFDIDTRPMIRIYGIKNCDTMKKAFAWCDANHISYEFHDYKKQGVPRDRLVHWCRSLGWQTLVNTKGPTWRKLAPGAAGDHHPGPGRGADDGISSVIRRPVVENDAGQILVGFDPTRFDSFVR
jgi:arsenate reductase